MYNAPSVCVPAWCHVVVHVARPLTGLTAAVAHPAIVAAPSVKRTVPAFGAGETVAVSVTGAPAAAVRVEALIVVAVGDGAGVLAIRSAVT